MATEEMNRELEEFSIEKLTSDTIVVTARDRYKVDDVVIKNKCIVTGFIDGADYSWFSNGSVLGYGYHPFDLRIIKPKPTA